MFSLSCSLFIVCTLGLSFVSLCVLLPVTHEYTMLTYSADELRRLRQNDVTVTRPARKVIFSLRLWCPKQMRERRRDQCASEIPTVIGNHHRRTMNLQPIYHRQRAIRVVDIDSSDLSTRDTSRSTSLQPPSLYYLRALRMMSSPCSPSRQCIWSPSMKQLSSPSSTRGSALTPHQLPSASPRLQCIWSPSLIAASSPSLLSRGSSLVVQLASRSSPSKQCIWSPTITSASPFKLPQGQTGSMVSSSNNHLAVRTPSLYLLNAAALSKPQAVNHLAADLSSYESDVAIITETHFKAKHPDGIVGIEGYTIFRRDRERRWGGGVALYVRSTLQSFEWKYSGDNRSYELLWVCVNKQTVIAALYHPPKHIYKLEMLLNYIELCIEELFHDYPAANVILAGDLNQLSDQELTERTGLSQIVTQPTRGNHILDQIFVSCPQSYSVIRVVTSVVKSDHKAVVAYPDSNQLAQPKSKTQLTYRKKTPTQHALFLQSLATTNFDYQPTFNEIDPSINTQQEFDYFYSIAQSLLNQFYPERTITLSSRDADFITPEIKAKLRKKNRLMRAGRVEEAGALAVRLGKDISKHEKGRFCKPGGGKMEAKDIWAAVRELTGGSHNEANCAGINAESLNQHYSNISTDSRFSQPPRKQSADTTEASYIAEYQVFHILDHLHHTATGLDGLPAWFLRLGAPAFSKPITRLFNLSIITSTVPKQWKHASIRPVAKVPAPKLHADFRPISITPVLTRVMEKTVVSHFLYPAFQSPPPNLSFCDQFAFRPTGSTTAAIITLVQTITTMLIINPYVIVVSLDFSKAFDTVRHSTLLEKMAQLDLPDNVYNWLVDFFSEHTHSTVYKGERSKIKSITASIIQGSSIGPASYVVNAGDLKAVTPGNCLVKFADDTYIVIPALNVDSRTAEVGNVETWACQNNLQLNASKTKEIIFVDRRRKRQIHQPPPLSEIKRVSYMKILGVTWTSGLAASEHVGDVIKRCAQTMYMRSEYSAHKA